MATNPLAPDPFVIGGTERRLPAAATPTFMPPATASNAPAPINTPQTGGLSYAERARIERLQPQVYGGNIGLTAPQPTGSTPAAPGFVIGGSVPGSPTPPSPTANGPSGSTAGSGNSYAANFGQGVLAQQTADAGVNPNSLVSTRLNALIDKDSEYMQLAKTRALQEMNARGLQNSSIAIGAGQAAAIEAARPIAEGDAAVYANNERDRQRGVLDKQARAEEYSFRASDAAAERLYRSQEAVAERHQVQS